MTGQDVVAVVYWLALAALVAVVLRPRNGATAGVGAGKVEITPLDRRQPAAPVLDPTLAAARKYGLETELAEARARRFTPTSFDIACAAHVEAKNELVIRVPIWFDRAIARETDNRWVH